MSTGLGSGELAGIIAAVVGGVVALGKGVAWLTSWVTKRIDARARKLDEREAALERRVSERLDSLEAEIKTVKEMCERWREAFMIVATEQLATNPASPALRRAQMLLAEAFPVHLALPDDMRASLEKLK